MRNRQETVREVRRPLIVSGAVWLIRLPALAAVALLLSALVEVVGILVGAWGFDHSYRVLDSELHWYNLPVKFGEKPVDLAIETIQATHRLLFVDSGLQRVAAFIGIDPGYVQAASNAAQVTSLRILVIVLNVIPIAFVLGLAATDGLVEREIRKYSADIEHDLPFHVAYRWIVPVAPWACVLYLAYPYTVRPSLVFAPLALVMWAATYLTLKNLLRFI